MLYGIVEECELVGSAIDAVSEAESPAPGVDLRAGIGLPAAVRIDTPAAHDRMDRHLGNAGHEVHLAPGGFLTGKGLVNIQPAERARGRNERPVRRKRWFVAEHVELHAGTREKPRRVRCDHPVAQDADASG